MPAEQAPDPIGVLNAFLEQRAALARQAPAILFFRARRANHGTDHRSPRAQAISVRNSVSPSIESVCRNVKYGRSPSVALRWAAAAMPEAIKGFREGKKASAGSSRLSQG